MDERHAIERLRCGEIGGLEWLVRHYQVRAVRTAYLLTHDLPLAEDVVQSAFLKADERIGQCAPQQPFAPWFFKSVIHDAIKAAQRRDRQTSLDALVTDDSAGDESLADDRLAPDALWEQATTVEQVRAALKKLKPEQRGVIVARYFLELSEAETAATFAQPLSTIKWRLHAAKQRLRLLLHPMMSE